MSEIKAVFEKVKDHSTVVVGGDFNRITFKDITNIRNLINTYGGFLEVTEKINQTYVPSRIEPVNLPNKLVRFFSPVLNFLGWPKKLDLVISRGLHKGESLALDTGKSDHYVLFVDLFAT